MSRMSLCCAAAIGAALMIHAMAAAAAGVPGTAAAATFVPWMCLERCPGGNASSVQARLKALAPQAALLARGGGVSFEMYNLGANGTLVDDTVESNLTLVAPQLRALGVPTHPMVSSWPYPPPFLEWMRQLWAPDGTAAARLTASLLREARRHGHAGYNIDWEPAHGQVTPDDARQYARFLSRLADALHAEGLQLSVDFAGWSDIWDWSELAASRVDRAVLMDYATKFDTFQEQLDRAVAAFGVADGRLSVALATTTDEAGARSRFAALRARGVRHSGAWAVPLQDWWWPMVSSFIDDA